MQESESCYSSIIKKLENRSSLIFKRKINNNNCHGKIPLVSDQKVENKSVVNFEICVVKFKLTNSKDPTLQRENYDTISTLKFSLYNIVLLYNRFQYF